MSKTAILLVLFFLGVLALAAVMTFLIREALRYSCTQEAQLQKEEAANSHLGQVLQQHRLRCKLTTQAVAHAAEVDEATVIRWENGTLSPTVPQLLTLSQLYQIQPEQLLRDASFADRQN